MRREWWVLAGFLTLCFISEAFASYFTQMGLEKWYSSLKMPSWAPPGWVFRSMWTFLYALMAIAAWFFWREVGSVSRAPTAFGIFCLQLASNTLWPLFFFAWHLLWLAWVDILLVIVAAGGTCYLFWKRCPIAGVLLTPLVGWAVFAMLLNLQIIFMNK